MRQVALNDKAICKDCGELETRKEKTACKVGDEAHTWTTDPVKAYRAGGIHLLNAYVPGDLQQPGIGAVICKTPKAVDKAIRMANELAAGHVRTRVEGEDIIVEVIK